MSKKYSWTENINDEIWGHGRFDTIEDCIKDALNEGINPGTEIIVGICEDYVPHVDIDSLLEDVEEAAYDECGSAAEDWLEYSHIKYKGYRDKDKMQEKMDKVLWEWLEESGQKPSFYRIFPFVNKIIVQE